MPLSPLGEFACPDCVARSIFIEGVLEPAAPVTCAGCGAHLGSVEFLFKVLRRAVKLAGGPEETAASTGLGGLKAGQTGGS
jgi:hypothetical protein